MWLWNQARVKQETLKPFTGSTLTFFSEGSLLLGAIFNLGNVLNEDLDTLILY